MTPESLSSSCKPFADTNTFFNLEEIVGTLSIRFSNSSNFLTFPSLLNLLNHVWLKWRYSWSIPKTSKTSLSSPPRSWSFKARILWLVLTTWVPRTLCGFFSVFVVLQPFKCNHINHHAHDDHIIDFLCSSPCSLCGRNFDLINMCRSLLFDCTYHSQDDHHNSVAYNWLLCSIPFWLEDWGWQIEKGSCWQYNGFSIYNFFFDKMWIYLYCCNAFSFLNFYFL